MRNIREEIVAKRRARIANEGHTLGSEVPAQRQVPIVPFLGDPPLICEVKRHSPSRGDISAGLDPTELAGTYLSHGVRTISILTEEDYFHGSLDDLMAVKRSFPECALLRKDFLIDTRDIDVSYRAGADAILLIAALLSTEKLAELMGAAEKRGLAALVELHDRADVEKVRGLRPPLVGINSRNLSTFAVDPLAPLRLHHLVDWHHTAVFESGVFTREHARLVTQSGFDALLVGEAVVRDPGRIHEITAGLCDSRSGVQAVHPAADFWRLLSERAGRRPLVKICGITNREDAELAVHLGADLIGFVMAHSPRRAEADFVRSIVDLNVLKVAVVVSGGEHGPLDEQAKHLLKEGFVDAVQFHGDETPEECAAWATPYYRALRISSVDDVAMIRSYGSPRVLVDARSARAYGGTGEQIAPEFVRAAAEIAPLWLAGGLNDQNVAEIVRNYQPELIDASSGLESAPGRKDPVRLKRFFKELANV